MDWILEHLQIVVFLVVVVFWIVRAMAGAKQTEGDEAPRSGSNPAEDPAAVERTRQIQEEIRRRILARQRGETVPPPMPAETPPPLVAYPEYAREELEREEEEYLEEGPRGPMPTAAARRQADTAQAAILEQQRMLADQLHALRAARASGMTVAPRAPGKLPHDASAAIAAHQLNCRRELLRDLRHPTSLRRAILLKEILGQPIALQRGWNLPRK